MKEKIVGILGFNGSVGKYATEKLLNEGIHVLGGQRKNEHLIGRYDNFDFEYVDVENIKMLNSFIE